MSKSVNYFPIEEYQRRWECVRQAMARKELDACLVSSPENVYYMTGLNYQGYFAFQALLFPLEGQPFIITRAMEKATVRDLVVPDVEHVGYSDGSGVSLEGTVPDRSSFIQQVDAVCRTINDVGLSSGRIGLEKSSNFFQLGVAEGIIAGIPNAKWSDCSGLVEECREVQSPLEIECTRAAAKISDDMMRSAIDAAGPGVAMADIVANVYATMIQGGGTPPGFIPFIRSTKTLEHEHGTWDQSKLETGEILFLEMSGCIRRYHAPVGRLVYIGDPPKGTASVLSASRDAIEAVVEAMEPGLKAGEVYQVWQETVNRAGFSEYRRHHCGYMVGIGFPPAWSGSGVPMGLRSNSDLELRPGMVFHLLSWLLETNQGSAFMSDSVVVTKDGCELLTSVSREQTVK